MEPECLNKFEMRKPDSQSVNTSNGSNAGTELRINSKARILKNLVVISIAVMLLLCALLPCRELQGSINIKDGLGTYTLTVSSFTTVASLLFLPPILIRKLGLKHSVTFSLVLVTVFYFANFKPTWGTMIPAAIVSGVGATPIWPAKATYITILAEYWSTAFAAPLDSTVSFLFGIFYAFYYFGYVWGNVASYFILTPTNVTEPLANETEKCGLYFCDSDAFAGNVNFKRPPDFEIYILFGVFIAMSLLGAVIVAFFLDHIEIPKTDALPESILTLLLKTMKNIVTPKQLLLLPMGILRGILRTFLSTEFTKAFVTCSWGIHNIGLTMVGFGVVCGAMSLILGRLVQWTGRLPLFILSLAIHVVVAVIVIEWKPNTEEMYLYFLVPCLLGVSNSIWESQVATIYAMMFPGEREVVFTIYGLSEDIGGMIAFGYSASLCTNHKLIIFMFSVSVAFVCYMVAEFRFLRRIKGISITHQ